MTQAALPFSLVGLEVRPCWQCAGVIEAIGERWWPFHSSLHRCPVHGEQWWLLGPGVYERREGML